MKFQLSYNGTSLTLRSQASWQLQDTKKPLYLWSYSMFLNTDLMSWWMSWKPSGSLVSVFHTLQLTGHPSTAPTLQKSHKYILSAESTKSLDVISYHQAEKEVSTKPQPRFKSHISSTYKLNLGCYLDHDLVAAWAWKDSTSHMEWHHADKLMWAKPVNHPLQNPRSLM